MLLIRELLLCQAEAGNKSGQLQSRSVALHGQHVALSDFLNTLSVNNINSAFRLLTLMYQAQTPEMENYIRHTLQDLKTLTRGLAVAEHRLSHAGAEWKADLTQRLTAASVTLSWQFNFDRDMKLSVVQWSALTRVLRELVSNALYHGHASRIDVQLQIEGPLLMLQVADDGRGREPQAWSHGLGMGGVRKRVKILRGEVSWEENTPHGIVCRVRVPEFTPPATPAETR